MYIKVGKVLLKWKQISFHLNLNQYYQHVQRSTAFWKLKKNPFHYQRTELAKTITFVSLVLNQEYLPNPSLSFFFTFWSKCSKVVDKASAFIHVYSFSPYTKHTHTKQTSLSQNCVSFFHFLLIFPSFLNFSVLSVPSLAPQIQLFVFLFGK